MNVGLSELVVPYEHAVAIARKGLQSILSSSRGDYALLAYDGFFTQNNKRDESLFIEAYDIRDPEGITLVFAIPYRSAQGKEGLAIYRPIVIETANLSDINTFLNHAYEGAQSHTKGSEFWEAHMDTPLMKSTEQLFATIMEGDIKQIQRLIEEGLHVNLADEAGCTLVHLAAFNNKKEIVEFLFEKGANINTQDNEGKTPLHLAVSNSDLPNIFVSLSLIIGGANVNVQDNRGKTPLHLAVSNSEFPNLEVIRSLIEKGANVNTKDNEGRTPLDYAISSGKEELIKILTEKTLLSDEGQISLEQEVEISLEDQYEDTSPYYFSSNEYREVPLESATALI